MPKMKNREIPFAHVGLFDLFRYENVEYQKTGPDQAEQLDTGETLPVSPTLKVVRGTFSPEAKRMMRKVRR